MKQLQWKRNSIRWDLLTLALSLLTACGSWSDPGTGNKVLEVSGTLVYDATSDNPASSIQVFVRRNGIIVPTAQVEVTDGEKKQTWTLPYNTQQQDSYTIDQLPWIFRLQLNVQAGSDNLSARLEGPTPHSMLKPLAGSRIERKGGLEIAWRSENGAKADEVLISLKNAKYSYRPKEDRGNHRIDGNTLGLGGDELSVSRTNRVALAGGAGNSNFQSTYRVATRFVVLEAE